MDTKTVRFTNSRSSPVELFLEPWAEELELESKTTITIEQEQSTEDSRLEIELIDEGVVVYGNLNLRLRIMRDQKLIWESYHAPPSA